MTMINYADEVPLPHLKRRKKKKTNKRRTNKTNKSSPSWSSLPDALALSCVARLTRQDYLALSLVSKSHRALVASPELVRARTLIGCTEPTFCVCLRIFPDLTPSWFFLNRNRRLRRIPSNPYQAPESSSFVVVDWGIYVIGGISNGNRPTSDVWFLDCFSRTWRQAPSMKMARASASASFVDGKIYVFGGCDDHSNWAEVFDPKTQTWNLLSVPKMPHGIHQSVVIEGKKVYAVDEEEYQSFSFSPSECKFWTRNRKRDYKRGYRNDWCAIGKVLFCRGSRRRILWCEPDNDFDWKEVKGLEEDLKNSLSGSRLYYHGALDALYSKPIDINYEISSLSSNSAGNIVIFWSVQLENPKHLELWSAEISVERREGGEIWD
ncbi:F-box/kelch-repeat protein At4g39560 [Eutrema salsugineum]|uniref:F-box/kelch-repeat protein At4g39560 n=1 Tax=Eutrema salsugineum TaxID=72664 RepID=UPI000CED2874|nr:F-box/kelch-repeat protein At4g39560 [Eutrema salsugineum]XP_024012749.1 F-box/kelch-repeat protein At4g39560 [Eutrema salsugineum]XP_024012750.1 F-box/kelch-repeat protein At4g39560 [Eutrema salsugineum]XP_024012751.1 F-box/kelch-repeat protein At4g39560 [Eutrema salsugineum]XP_024012752.1 F-box/kelch-repeat protein At4g39560 [Eutrema salsugineum]XP_024012753.1 F-box/kelch-repeat protein At4g39560 [Eutrema salsugineum]XP_024012754.1 F-box/kelch-repeat protein At4g39560 [Eutrema salsugineu